MESLEHKINGGTFNNVNEGNIVVELRGEYNNGTMNEHNNTEKL